jgi:hypothetical protein
MRQTSARKLMVLCAASIGWLGILNANGAAIASAASANGNTSQRTSFPFHVSTILEGASLHHTFVPSGTATRQTEALSDPDDITQLGDELFVGFQNGVGPQGQPSANGNLDSTVVELSLTGHVTGQWDVAGKTDGVTADLALGGVIATVNEDADSALYTIRPIATSAAKVVTRYTYSEPLPHGGGTDAISIFNGQILISASAPGTTGLPAPQPTYPAVYSVTLDPSTQVADVVPLFDDEDSVSVANVNSADFGRTTQLALTDPDSNEVVPLDGLRFGGDFMLTSQGDQEQIYVGNAGSSHQHLSELSLSQAVDDTAWPTERYGALYSTDSTNDAVDVVTGRFSRYLPLAVATPCGANSAPATCPGPGYPANYLAKLNPWTGELTAVLVQGAPYVPQGGLTFVPSPSGPSRK